MAGRGYTGAGPKMSRRDMLTATIWGVGTAFSMVSCAGAASRKPAASGTAVSSASQGWRLFAQADLNFSASFALGEAAYGASEVGEVLATVERINAAGASYQDYTDGFGLLAARLAALGDAEMRANHPVSARSASLRAAHYYKQVLYFILGSQRPFDEAAVYASMQEQWQRASQLFDPPLAPVQIPYENTTLPGYFLSPKPHGTRRPTIILNNGSDAQNVDLWAYGGAAALERGYNALIFEGPGQGAMLFERQMPFRPEWEKVITPVVDYLVGRNDVDADRIGIIGWSMGGGLVARAAAFEPRLAAVCCDPGVADVWASFPETLHKIAKAGDKDLVNHIWKEKVLADLNPVERFTLMKRTGMFGKRFLAAAREGRVTDDFYDLVNTLKRFRFIDVVSRITAPVLVTSYEHDHTVPPGTAQQVYDALRCPKRLVTFTASEGAGAHDAPLAPQRRNQVVFDWLDEVLA